MSILAVFSAAPDMVAGHTTTTTASQQRVFRFRVISTLRRSHNVLEVVFGRRRTEQETTVVQANGGRQHWLSPAIRRRVKRPRQVNGVTHEDNKHGRSSLARRGCARVKRLCVWVCVRERAHAAVAVPLRIRDQTTSHHRPSAEHVCY